MKLNHIKTVNRLNEVIITWPINQASVDENIFIAESSYRILKVATRYAVKSTSGTVTLVKCASGTAPASGTSIGSTLSLSGTANTNYSSVPTSEQGITSAHALALKYGGTMAGLVGGCVTIHLKRV